MPAACHCLYEGRAGQAPGSSSAPERAAAAGYPRPARRHRDPYRPQAAANHHGAGLRWSGRHRHHGQNVQVIAVPDGRPLRVCPQREHDTACADGLVTALDRLAATLDIPTLDIPTLTDLGHKNAGPGSRHPAKKPTRSPREANSPKNS